MLAHSLEANTLDNLQALITDRVPEGKTIEYKRDFYRLDSTDADDRRRQHEELLKDVSSFANTIGGDLIIGMDAQQGLPVAVCGFEHGNADALKLRISELLQNHLEPRISVGLHAIHHSAGRVALIVRMQQSRIGPHRVVYQRQFGQFWARNSAGAYAMDTPELRQAFTDSQALGDMIAAFLDGRINAIRTGNTPVPLIEGPRIVCHLVPLEAFSARADHSMQALEAQLVNLPLLHFSGGWSPKYTEEGIVSCDGFQSPHGGYVQLSRNGVIESVSAYDVTWSHDQDPQKHPFLTTYYEQELITRLPQYCAALRSLGTPTPVSIFMSLTGMQGVRIHVAHAVGIPIDRDVIRLPGVDIGSLEIQDFAPVLQATFDRLWNIAGYPRCLGYRNDGRFTYR